MSELAEAAVLVSRARKISNEITELAEMISHRLTMDTNTGVASVDDSTYVDLLPDGITREVVEKVQHHTMNMSAAALLALGEASIPVLKENSSLKETKLSVPIVNKDSIDVSFGRTKDTPYVDSSGVGQIKTTYGVGSVKVDNYGIGKRGDLLKVKAMLAEQAQKELSK